MYQIKTTHRFDLWFDALKDRSAKARIQMRIDRAESGHFGDCEPVGNGVSEMRIHIGAGYRVYFKRSGTEIIILLVGGDKSTQANDIKTALNLAQELRIKNEYIRITQLGFGRASQDGRRHVAIFGCMF
ncbi:type II toxin-antitoxin system RelE/ParE family toxin [Undibacterium fentianense]|uniref:Type II toxin-antitoxin system RelE/ParE family toxin n=2 Tax=Undibacterium TaxID=401469 RepID=A0A941E878_9BURK|nr:type II toxin-antitoxin system RelE/ParE family toxin [Undibacterium fentianense]MBR7800468.1 type II toxin-antitoxin system RelE/ParE family toxin [Undibacterium fentianense]